ncbi:MAG: mevalonate kinase [Gammaproteobacteria bacterium]|nr:mevalonate kinase [Gammaproteobacteria bacterium]
MIKEFQVKKIVARAPAKIILSGEHAVVYGKPALAMAINRFTETSLQPHPENAIMLNLLDLNFSRAFSPSALQNLKHSIQLRYQKFTLGQCQINDVVNLPEELLQYALGCCIEKLKFNMHAGITININSNVPIGCGMGSSAAMLISFIYALVDFYTVKMDIGKYLALGREIENLQHGYSSGLDLYLAVNGGCYYFVADEIKSRSLPNLPICLVHTGKPESNTGACVSKAAVHFKKSSLGDDFAAVTNAMDTALNDNNLSATKACVRENHKLLTKLGVVPTKVGEFIQQVERVGSAAKITGAGAAYGNNAGMLLVVGVADLTDLAASYGYEVMHVHGETSGVKII